MFILTPFGMGILCLWVYRSFVFLPISFSAFLFISSLFFPLSLHVLALWWSLEGSPERGLAVRKRFAVLRHAYSQ